MIPHLHETVQIGRNFPRKRQIHVSAKRSKSAQFETTQNTSDRFFVTKQGVEFHMLQKLNIKTRCGVKPSPDAGGL